MLKSLAIAILFGLAPYGQSDQRANPIVSAVEKYESLMDMLTSDTDLSFSDFKHLESRHREFESMRKELEHLLTEASSVSDSDFKPMYESAHAELHKHISINPDFHWVFQEIQKRRLTNTSSVDLTVSDIEKDMDPEVKLGLEADSDATSGASAGTEEADRILNATNAFTVLGLSRDILNLSSTERSKIVRQAYNRFIRVWHPDLNGQSELSTKITRRLNMARDKLLSADPDVLFGRHQSSDQSRFFSDMIKVMHLALPTKSESVDVQERIEKLNQIFFNSGYSGEELSLIVNWLSAEIGKDLYFEMHFIHKFNSAQILLGFLEQNSFPNDSLKVHLLNQVFLLAGELNDKVQRQVIGDRIIRIAQEMDPETVSKYSDLPSSKSWPGAMKCQSLISKGAAFLDKYWWAVGLVVLALMGNSG